MNMKGILTASLCLIPLLAPAASAVPPPAGPNFQVNQVTYLSQSHPGVAQDAGNDFVVVWIDSSAYPGPPTVKIRLFAATGAPRTDEIVVATTPQSSSPPRVAVTPAGEIAVAWEDHQVIYLRRFDRLGQAKGDAFVVAPAPNALRHSPDVALDSAGNAFVAWAVKQLFGDGILLQRLGADDQPLGPPEQVNAVQSFPRGAPKLALGTAGSLLVSWDDQRLGDLNVDVWARRYDGPSQTWNAEVQISSADHGVQKGSAPILYPEGDGVVVFNDFNVAGSERILFRRLDATGAPSGDPVKIGDLGDADMFALSAAAGPDGTALVIWQEAEGEAPLVHAAFFDRAWNPLGESFLVSNPTEDSEWLPAVAAGGTGNFVTAWGSAGALIDTPIPEPPGGYADGRDGSEYGIFAQRFQPPGCVPSSEALCLRGRFQAEVSWRDPTTGATVAAHTRTLTGDTGAFWFSNPDNLELMVRMVDARTVNGHFWVDYGALSNVDFTVTVTDVVTGAVKAYHNSAGVFASLHDDQAFAEAPPAVQGGVSPGPPPPPQTATAHCTPSATVLCVLNRFAVRVDFVDPDTGTPKAAQAIAVTGSTGVFGLTDPASPELMVKVLDARAVNHYFWVFFGATSDLEYTVTVTDNVNRVTKTYHNPAHHLASVADTRAFRARTGLGH